MDLQTALAEIKRGAEEILIEDELDKLNSIFEKNYLSALLKIREGNYLQAYQLLINHLDENILYFSFYDELVISAKITNNLAQLNNWLQGRRRSVLFAGRRYLRRSLLWLFLSLDGQQRHQ